MKHARLEEPHERFEFDERLEERRYEAQRRSYEDATCADCEYCHMLNSAAMQPHVKYVIATIRKLYALRPDVERSEESVEYDIARCCENARFLAAWCTKADDFIDAEDPAAECEWFSC